MIRYHNSLLLIIACATDPLQTYDPMKMAAIHPETQRYRCKPALLSSAAFPARTFFCLALGFGQKFRKIFLTSNSSSFNALVVRTMASCNIKKVATNSTSLHIHWRNRHQIIYSAY
mmetsp:Transcript_12837/g.20580  ORF Transcript_12837/g.20580 Transcript_12837/m.20580 type:complete len:116 (-) Transcript_12837:771-1118(-)